MKISQLRNIIRKIIREAAAAATSAPQQRAPLEQPTQDCCEWCAKEQSGGRSAGPPPRGCEPWMCDDCDRSDIESMPPPSTCPPNADSIMAWNCANNQGYAHNCITVDNSTPLVGQMIHMQNTVYKISAVGSTFPGQSPTNYPYLNLNSASGVDCGYNCVNNNCVFDGSGNATYPTEISCQASCQAPTHVCYDFNCLPVATIDLQILLSNGGIAHTSLQSCQTHPPGPPAHNTHCT